MRKLLTLFVIAVSQFLFSQSDCVTALAVCGNSDLSYTPTGPGTVLEDLGGCMSTDEHFSVWYTFSIATSGTLAFTIDSNVDPDDYDFAVYGPNVTCAAFGAPIRCNYAGSNPAGLTGLSLTVPYSNYYDRYLDVVAGETYYLVVDNFSRSANGFSLNWSGTATLSSAFNDPVLAPHPFITPGTPVTGGPNQITICPLPTTFDFSTLNSTITNGNLNFVVSYHYNANDALLGTNPITAPVTVNGSDTYFYSLHYQDPVDPNNILNRCRITGSFKFVLGALVPQSATIYACNDNGAGTGIFNLTSANVYPAEPTANKKFYPTQADLIAGTNEITNPLNYVSNEKTIYVKVTNAGSCTGNTEINLRFYPTVTVQEATIESCFIEGDILNARFDLTTANVTTQTGTTKKYYRTQAEALANVNPIADVNNYLSPTTSIYVRVYNGDGCYAIAKINLIVLPPKKSTVLQNKTICFESRTTLDAGPGFDAYEWSTGATTQSINNVAVGNYWVKLKTGKCYTYQEVKVYPTVQPVISSIDITNNSITINVIGGTAPYKYSLDGVTWQDSNVFTNLPRGENSVYVIDASNCTPVHIQITVPNLVNVITPNGDNVNDEVDYTALAYKNNLVFTVYDRYGNKMYVADKIRNYKWNGTSGGKKILTGTYWYTITWTENDKNQTPTKYTGWILVKNRD